MSGWKPEVVQCHFCLEHGSGATVYHFDEDQRCPVCNAGVYWQISKEATPEMTALAHTQTALRTLRSALVYARNYHILNDDFVQHMHAVIRDFVDQSASVV